MPAGKLHDGYDYSIYFNNRIQSIRMWVKNTNNYKYFTSNLADH